MVPLPLGEGGEADDAAVMTGEMLQQLLSPDIPHEDVFPHTFNILLIEEHKQSMKNMFL